MASRLNSATARATAPLAPAGARQQVKAVVDVLERGTQHQRLPGLQELLGALFALKNRRAIAALPAPTPDVEPSPPAAAVEPESQWIQDCDLSRTRHAATVVDRALLGLPRERCSPEETGELVPTNVACRLLDRRSGQCSNYRHRRAFVSECVRLTSGNVADIDWLPSTCAYRLRANGQPLHITPTLAASSGTTLLELAISGVGIVCLADFMTQAPRQRGALVEVLPDHTTLITQPIHAVYYRQATLSHRTRLFMEFLAERLPPHYV